MNSELCALAMSMEEHEAAVWAECVAAASALPGDPLRAAIDRSGPLSLVALCEFDRPDLNRVVGLGTRSPARVEDLDAIWSFYEEHGQRNFRIYLSPFANPPELGEWLTARGLTCKGPGTFKLWRSVQAPLVNAPDVEVRRLGPADTDAIADLNLVAWGALGGSAMRAWFGATVGRAGCQHYGVFEADRLVATGAMFVGDGLGWLGFDATHPRYRDRMLRQAISSVRLADAAAQECRFIHAESEFPLRAGAARDGWELLYETQNYST